ANTALTQQITTVNATVGTLSTTVQQETTARINADNSLFAQYTVKIDQNGHVSGFGLASETVNGTTTSAFIVRADKFAVVDPNSTSNNLTNSPSSDAVPFSVVNGTVYIKDAMIREASITNAKIVSLTANKITAGYINAAIGLNGAKVYGAELYAGGTVTVSTDGSGNVIGFTPNNPTINISGGNATFVASNFLIKSSASSTSSTGVFQVVDGQVRIQEALIADGTITVAKIVNEIKSVGYTPGSNGWSINTATGVAEFQNVTLRGVLQSTDGQFVINTNTKVISISV
ncbi:MAG: phage tail tip fiber protein, partial [Ilumatobacteraceae bacterium]